MVEIREIRLPADWPALLRLIEDHARYERGSIDADGLDVRLADLVAAGRLRIWVADAGGDLIGYASATIDVATWNGREFLYLDCLFIDEAKRSAGVGARLLETVYECGVQLGADNVQWQTPEWNIDAIRFYDRHGAGRSAKQRFTRPLLLTGDANLR